MTPFKVTIVFIEDKQVVTAINAATLVGRKGHATCLNGD